MKIVLVIIISLLLVTIKLDAQIQYGCVKTKGRLASNGTVISGTRISGATVQVKGRSAVLSQSNGTFSFPIPSQNFYLQSVQKQGYVMTDPDALSKQYAYSKNPLVLVLETPSQQADDKLTAEKKIRRTLQRQLQEKEDEIESLKEQQKLSEEEYRKQMQELYAQQESDEKLISQMAERYSQIDYDQLDDFNRQVSIFILNGELQKADSLLNTKGDIVSDISEFLHLQDVNAKEQEELAQRKENLDKSVAYENWKKEDLAQRCYNKFEIFKMNHQNDSAAFYLELRLRINPDNLKWMNEFGYFLERHQAKFAQALKIYEDILSKALLLYGDSTYWVGHTYNDIASILCYQGDYENALTLLVKALEIQRNVLGDDHSDVAMNLHDIGICYYNLNDYDNALYYIEKALKYQLDVLGESHIDVAMSYQDLGIVRTFQNKPEEACENFLKAIKVIKKTTGEYNPLLALTYNHLGNLLIYVGEYDYAQIYLQLAMAIQQKVLVKWHPERALTHYNLGKLYFIKKEYERALVDTNEVLQIFKSLDVHNQKDIDNCIQLIDRINKMSELHN